MSYIAVTKFEDYQHYKNRRPPWVKFYVKLLDPIHPLNQLPIATRYLFDRLLLLAAEYDNAIPNDFELIANLLRMDPEQCRESLAELAKGRWIKETKTKRRASKVASESLPPETETELEKDPPLSPPTRVNGWVKDLNLYTGCKLVRGEAGLGHVYDVLGKDRPPSNWPHERPTKEQIHDALEVG